MGGVNCIQTFFGFLEGFFIFARSLRDCGTNWSNLALLSQLSPLMLYAANGAVPQYPSPILFCFYIISVILTPGKINGIDLNTFFNINVHRENHVFFTVRAYNIIILHISGEVYLNLKLYNSEVRIIM